MHDLETNTSYDKDDIPAKTMAEIRKKYVTDTRFTPEAAEKASKAAAGMCKWVYAMETYDRVAKVMYSRQSLKLDRIYSFLFRASNEHSFVPESICFTSGFGDNSGS